MAQTTGTSVTFSDSASPVSQAVTIPAGTTCVVLTIAGFRGDANWLPAANFTIGGATFVQAVTTANQTAREQGWIWYALNPTTGAQTLAGSWGGGAPGEGLTFAVHFLEAVNTSSPVKDTDSVAATGAASITSLSAVSGDYSIALRSAYDVLGAITGGTQLARANTASLAHVEANGGDGVTSFSCTLGAFDTFLAAVFADDTGGGGTAPTITDAGDEVFLDGETGIVITGTDLPTTAGAVIISPTDNAADGSAVAQTITNRTGGTSVTFTAVRGSLPLNTNLYLFVTNDDSLTNAAGYVVQLEGFVSADLAASYAVSEFVSADLAASFAASAFVASDLAASYNALEYVSADLAASFAASAFANADLAISYTQLGVTVYIRERLVNLAEAALTSQSGITALIYHAEPGAGNQTPDQVLTGLTTDSAGDTDWQIDAGSLADPDPVWVILLQPGSSPYRMTARRIVPDYVEA